MDPRRIAIQRWRTALSSDDATERSGAAESPPEDALPDEVATGLVPLLDDPVDVVRLCAAETLGRFPGPAALAALRAFVARETAPLVKAYGLSSLAWIGTSEDLRTLLPETAPDRPAHVRIHALAGASELVRRTVKLELTALLDHGAPEVRVSAAEALATVLGPHDDDDALQALAACADREPIEARRADLLAALHALRGDDEDAGP